MASTTQCEERDEVASDEGDRYAARAAIESGSWPPVEAWVQRHGVNAALTGSGQSALSVAAERGVIFVVRALLAASADPASCDGQGLSVLLHAARKGHTPVVTALLEAGAAPDWPADIYGNA